jgi:hypothetical protein
MKRTLVFSFLILLWCNVFSQDTVLLKNELNINLFNLSIIPVQEDGAMSYYYSVLPFKGGIEYYRFWDGKNALGGGISDVYNKFEIDGLENYKYGYILSYVDLSFGYKHYLKSGKFGLFYSTGLLLGAGNVIVDDYNFVRDIKRIYPGIFLEIGPEIKLYKNLYLKFLVYFQ